MIAKTTKFRVRYADTDQMGYMYYGNYPQYLEMGRTEWLRELGFSYKEMERSGVMLPVNGLKIKYLKPLRYDEEVTMITYIKSEPLVRIEFFYELYNEQKELCTKASTILVFVDMFTGKPIKIPSDLLEVVRTFLIEN
ncbi:MAG: acyl-CoA thioesterase [Flavobacteriaceae bacterium]|nr:acyl-CoA thioesterase [Flavobacteriaceae bacterium]